MRNKSFILFSLILAIPAFFLAANFFDTFESDINKCGRADKNSKFSCYKAAIIEHYGENWEKLSSYLKNEGQSLSFNDGSSRAAYGVFGTNCHTFYHAYGDYVAEFAPASEVRLLIDHTLPTCTSGSVMGLYKRLALKNNFSAAVYSDMFKYCRDNEKHQCAHEIGHTLHDKYSSSLLEPIDSIGAEEYGLSQKTDYKYTFQSKPDLEAPFEDCENILPYNEWPYCFTGVGHNMFVFANFSGKGYRKSFEDCATGATLHKDDCLSFIVYRIGINDAGPKTIAGNSSEGGKICTSIISELKRSDLEHHCYVGIGGSIGLFADSEYSSRLEEENAAVIKHELSGLADLCSEFQDEMKKSCYLGIMGTGFKKLYKLLNMNHPEIEKIIPEIDNDFQIVG